jgi:hypothetical protein
MFTKAKSFRARVPIAVSMSKIVFLPYLPVRKNVNTAEAKLHMPMLIEYNPGKVG